MNITSSFLRNHLSVKIVLLCILILSVADMHAQVFIERNVSGTSNSANQFGATAARRTQQLYTPGDLGSPISSGVIEEIYFMYNSTAAQTFTDLEIYIGQTANTSLSTDLSSNFSNAGMVKVFGPASFTIPAGTAGNWFAIPLTILYTGYVSSQSLVVETRWTTNPTSTSWAVRTGASDASGTNKKAYSNSATGTTGTLATTRANFRFKLSVAPDDAGISKIVSPITPAAPGTNAVIVELKNYGSVTLTQAVINWEVDGASQSPYNWNGSLAPGAATNVNIGNYNFSSGVQTITASASLVGLSDANPDNDMASSSVNFCESLPSVVTVDQLAPPSATNFTSFNELSLRLSQCGISSHLTVNVINGPYNEQVVFNAVPGAGPTAKITINGNGQVLEFAPTTTDRHILRLNNAQHFVIDNLTVRLGAAATHGYGIHLFNGSSNNTIKNCTIDFVTNPGSNSSGTFYAGIAVSNSTTSATTEDNVHNVVIKNNQILGGTTMGYGVTIVGTDANKSNGDSIFQNTITGFKSRGILAYYTSNLVIEGNTMHGTANAMYIWNTHENIKITGNKISASATSAYEGIYLGSLTGNSIVSNNLIHNISSASAAVYGIRLQGASATGKIYHNTIILDDQTSTAGDAFAINESSAANTGYEYRNNIFYVTRTGSGTKAAFSLASGTNITNATGLNSDNNVFYVPAGAIVHHRTTTPANYNTLADWLIANNNTKDVSSFETDPAFQSGTAIPTSGIINNQAATGLNITTDITGATRGASPDPGAYEFSPAADDAAITNFILPALPYCNTMLDVTFELTNAGASTLSNAKIDWSVNGVAQTQYNWSGTLASGASTSVVLGTVPVTGSNVYNFIATVSNPNGNTDANAANNSFTFSGFRRGMEGTFTIDGTNPSSATNYSTFQSLSNDLSLYGVCGNVTINVLNGPYTEQVTFNAIPGTSSTSTVTLNGNGHELFFDPITAANDHILKLDGVNFMIVENLSIRSGSAQYGRGIFITGDASNLIIRNNEIQVSKTHTASDNFGIIVSGANYLLDGSISENLTITGNTVSGGYTGIQLTGDGYNTLAQKLKNTLISNNTVKDFYAYGIYLNYTDNVRVDSNLVSRPTRTNSGSDSQTPCGIIANSGSTNFMLENNTISDLFAGMTGSELDKIARGIYIGGTTTAQSSGTVQNNLIYGFTNTASQYGIQNNSTVGPINIYHNTIALDHTSNASAGSSTTIAVHMSNSTAQNGTTVRNNIFYITRGGASTKRLISVSSASTSLTSDHNVFYLNTSSGDNAIASVGSGTSATVYNTLTDWKSSGKDANSVNEDPQFVNASAGDFKPSNYFIDGNIIGTTYVGVTEDIEGTTRSANPDPGVYEFSLPPCTTPAAGTPVTSLNFVCSGESFTLNLTGINPADGLMFHWESSADGTTWTDVSSPSVSPVFATTITSNTYFRAVSSCNGGTEVPSPSILIQVRAALIGIYTIDKNAAASSTNFTSINEAVYAMRCGVSGPVTFNVVVGSGPYNEQVIITPITGASVTNTITFNGNNETIDFVSTTSTERAVIKLNGADHITIKNFIINTVGTTTSQYGYGIQLLNDADDNVIDNCTINTNVTLASSNYFGIMINSSATGSVTTTGNSGCDNNTISNNIVTGGNAGIALVANSNTSQILNNKVVNNTVKDFYSHGIYLNGGVNTLIEGNIINKANRSGTTTAFYGINLVNNSVGTIISKNKIYAPFRSATSSSSDAIGIKLNNANSTAGNETLISNNIVYDFVKGSDHYGIHINGGDHVKIYHNTILLDDPLATCTTCFTRGLFVESAATVGLDIRNNIFAINRSGSGEKQAMFFAPTNVAGFTIDNNVHYLSQTMSGTNDLVKVATTSYIDLTAWQSTGKDVNGLSIDPAFVDPSMGDLTPQSNSINNIGTPVGILTDITGAARSATSPDPGAYEFGAPLPVTLISFRGEQSDNINKLIWSTATETNNKGFELERSADGRNFSSVTFVATKAENGNSTSTVNYSYNDARPNAGDNYYRLKQIDRDGKFSYSNVVLLSRKVTDITLSSVYPNPTERELNLVITSPRSEKVMIIVADLTGKIVMQRSTQLMIGNNQETLNVQQLSSGTYIIKAVCANGCETAVHRFVKQ